MESSTDELVGYSAAAEYLGVQRNTLSSYMTKGTGPVPSDKRVVGQYVLAVFTREELDRWKAEKKGQGFRSDLVPVGD